MHVSALALMSALALALCISKARFKRRIFAASNSIGIRVDTNALNSASF